MAASIKPVKLLAVCGSLRKGSANMGLVRAAMRRLPDGCTMQVADLSKLPIYNDDLWQGENTDVKLPEPVRTLRAQIADADAILFANPEYNFSVSSSLKTAIDWGSKNPNVWSGKAGAVVGAGGGAGAARATAHLRGICGYIDVHLLNAPNEIQIARFSPPGSGWFDGETGDVIDKGLEDRVAKLVEALADWARKIK